MSLLPLLVGEVNPYGASPEFALYPLPRHASGNRLREILGITDSQYMNWFARENLCAGKWSQPVADIRAHDILDRSRERTIILLGAKVRRAFRGPPAFDSALDTVIPSHGNRLISLPHPSGLCREWNTPGAVQRARAVLRGADSYLWARIPA